METLGAPVTANGGSGYLVRVPGSTSNLGSGFDAVGVAIDRWLEVTARVRGDASGVVMERAGTLTGLDCRFDDDLVWRGFVAACTALQHTPPASVEFHASSTIPLARGLGSSAAALVAGVILANTVLGGDLDSAAVIDIAASLEGHPDNVASSVIGGAVLSVRQGDRGYSSAPIQVHSSLRFVFLVPDFEVRTAAARAVLPATVDFSLAVSAEARAAALVLGLQAGDATMLGLALDDLLHVPFRRALIRGYNTVTRAAIQAGAIGATLSGSGSSIVAVAREDIACSVREAALDAWRGAGVVAESFITAAETSGATLSVV